MYFFTGLAVLVMLGLGVGTYKSKKLQDEHKLNEMEILRGK